MEEKMMENTEKSVRDTGKKYAKILNYKYQEPENARREQWSQSSIDETMVKSFPP